MSNGFFKTPRSLGGAAKPLPSPGSTAPGSSIPGQLHKVLKGATLPVSGQRKQPPRTQSQSPGGSAPDNKPDSTQTDGAFAGPAKPRLRALDRLGAKYPGVAQRFQRGPEAAGGQPKYGRALMKKPTAGG